ncbi:sensor of ECF-type sigma factor [Ichthyenterobacterium magnum]|uniref:LTXXQ motif family protein n=1 Tax=Ichthyenterobacterium magnum TaxID=1230530 RepID=A0A420DLD6_9FLAO|nr:sensor of ECF-type sigma factor [Ichthyenterobacterium magnum]RKE95018.1 hypothetical protein BXY80_2036 [Ichthyenterobacterium magnum]
MKKIIITLLFLAISFNSFSQKQKRGKHIKALKIAFITERLDLTTEEAEQFWPVYNAFETQRESLRKESRELRRGLDIETISDKEANDLVNSLISLENKRHSIQTNQIKDLLKVLPAKKIILLKATEDAFNKRMFEEMKKRKEQFRKNKP